MLLCVAPLGVFFPLQFDKKKRLKKQSLRVFFRNVLLHTLTAIGLRLTPVRAVDKYL